MEELVGIVVAVLVFVIQVTIRSLVFVYLLIRAAFSSSYREKLAVEWNSGAWRRFSIVCGLVVYTVALVVALAFWIPVIAGYNTN